jgi:serine/threonine-protein kinase
MAVIDRDRWRELGPLFERALELEGEARAAWLVELGSRSPELATELTALLARDAAADRQGFLEGPLDLPLDADAAEGAAAARSHMDLVAYLQAALGDSYAIERELGGGGMSRVFVAREHALGRTVVIKVLLPVLAASISAERFAREVRVVAALQHPNVAPLFRAGEAGGLPYYVMPYVRGESLRARLTREGRLPTADALSVLRDVARALAFAHEQGVVHRDVKPENVLLAGDAAVVTDFGIAKAVVAAAEPDVRNAGEESAREPRTLSAIGTTIGTPAYMAPEQAAGDPRVDHRADLYAWGVMAYELLAGVHPFADSTTPQQQLAAHLSRTAAPLCDSAPDLSPTLAALVMRCLEKDPVRRPQSAREILDAVAIVATPPAGDVALRQREHQRVRRMLLAGAGLFAAVLTAFFVMARPVDRSDGRGGTATPSLAVLPFDDVGGDTANAYFGGGIAAEISTALSKAGGLRIASPTSVAAYRASHAVDVRELGHQLGVSAVLEGRVRRSGDRMRLTVQLTSVADGLTLWSDVYERQLTDVFRVQDEIARSIASALSARLPGISAPHPGRLISAPGTTNVEAYDLYLRGSYMLERRGPGVSKAVEYFERAIAADSTFARAHAGLAYALELSPVFGGRPPRTVERRAMDAAHRALALDSTSAEAYTALGILHTHALRWGKAEEAFRHAVSANPGYAPGQYHYGDYLLRVGRVADAEEPIRRARNVDPLSGTASVTLAYCLSLLGRYEESLAEGRRAYELDSSLYVTHTRLALAVLHAGHPAEARALARVPLPLPFNGSAAYVLGTTGDTARAAATVRELEARPRGEWQVASALTYAYLGLGDTARALAALEAATSGGEASLIPLTDPMYDPLRRTARFAAAVRRIGLDERLFTSPTGGRPR